jgi:hypothetical protein
VTGPRTAVSEILVANVFEQSTIGPLWLSPFAFGAAREPSPEDPHDDLREGSVAFLEHLEELRQRKGRWRFPLPRRHHGELSRRGLL